MDEAVLSALQLRILVLALGEVATPPWWRTNLLSATGRRFCERLFPRSALAAALHASGKAACVVHDEAIGTRGVFHLFRLPEHIERDIREQLMDTGSSAHCIKGDLDDGDEMLKRLQEIGQGAKDAHVGPRKVAVADELDDPKTYARMAALYLSAFRNSERTFPYAEVTE